MKIVSGMRPTGKLHLGHLMPIEKWVELQNSGNDTQFFIANWHAYTSHRDTPQIIDDATLDLVRHYLACGINPEKSIVFIQSAVKEHAELSLLLGMLISVSRLERVPTYKEMQENVTDKDLSTIGFLGYPVLMATDILIYKADAVPVGEDQIYHLELAREIARKFNMTYGVEILKEPQPIISRVAKLPGTDGRKMSKSYNNSIIIDSNAQELKSKIMPMITDPARMKRTDPGDPEKCPVWEFHKAFTNSESEKQWVTGGCKSAGIGCIDCKKVLLKNLEAKMQPIWDNLSKISEDDARGVVEKGNARAREIACNTMSEVRCAMKLRW